MAATSQPNVLLTAEQYAELPDKSGLRDELIEGEVVLSPLPQAANTAVIENLEDLLKRKFAGSAWRVVRESGWHFQLPDGKDSVPGPDLMVIGEEDYQRSIRSRGWFQGQPLFVVEVISPSERKYRRLQKIGLYLEAGAGAVIEVDYVRRNVLVYRPSEDFVEVIKEDGAMTWPFEAYSAEIFSRL